MVRSAWRRLKGRVIYWFLGILRRLARWFPRLHVPGWLPLVGDIDNRTWAAPVEVRAKGFGRSMTIPAILEIHIDGKTGTTTPAALEPVATRLFAGYDPFIFNVSFACGRSPMFRPSVYANPSSPWFNVFVGYYQIDVPRGPWQRPFGYTADGTLALDDLRRLGEADWNYFSNFMYGVPIDAITPVDQPDSRATVLPRRTIGTRQWDHVEVTRMKVVSPYLARPDHRQLVANDALLSDVWRCVFGQPFRGHDPRQSFIPTEMRARLFACWTEDTDDRDWRCPVYRTFIFGGTVNDWWGARSVENAAHNDRFLELQMETIEALITREFPHLGFS